MRATSPITGVYSGLPALGTNVYLGIPALGTKVYPGLAAPVAKAYTFRCGNMRLIVLIGIRRHSDFKYLILLCGAWADRDEKRK